MSDRTPDDIIRSDECNTYVMSCHLTSQDLYKAMREDIQTMCKEYATLKAQRDELLVAIKALRGDKPCGHNYTCCCPDDLATAAIANAEARD